MKIKVSNVCQLVDPKHIHTIVDRGVTFTSNGDGSITVNGTPTGEYYSVGTIALNIESIKPNHKYVVYDVNKGPIISELIIANYQGGYIYKGIGNIFTFPEHDYTRFVFEIRVNLNQTANNIVVRPQIFDLTEMYGAGNEPKTLAEFRKDFPNEMYEYSPECWKRCKELKYVTETKNLFDKSNADIISREYYFTPNQGAGSNFYVMNVKPGITYTITYERFIKSTDTGAPNALELSVQTGTHYKDGTQLLFMVGNGERGVWVKHSKQFTIPNDINQVTFSGLKDRFLYRNFMVQEGSVASSYQPYGYLPLRTGRYRTETRNLFDINANSEKGYYDEQGNFYPNDRFLCFTIDVISNNTYCISTSRLGSVKGIISFWNNNAFVSAVNYGEQTAFAYTVPSGANKLKFVIEADQKYSNIQVELGTTATHYQPYKHIYFH